MNLKKILMLAITSAAPIMAGGINTNTNQSAAFLRSIARDASTDVDAPYANPSGTAFMKDGWHISLNTQTFFQNRYARVDKSSVIEEGREFKGESFVPSLPSLFLAWHHGDFALSSHLGVIGGGGSVEFDDGIPTFAALLASPLKQMEAGLTEKGLKTTNSAVDISLDASSFIYGATFGAAYKIKDMFSVYAGARFNYAVNKYDGAVENLKLNPTIPGVNPKAKMMKASELAQTFNALAEKAETKEEKVQYATLAQTFETLDEKTSMELDLEQAGWGITPIFGLGFQYKDWTVGAKLEYNTSIEVENDTKKNTTPLEKFNDGKKDHADIPTLVAVGLTYSILDNLRFSLGYHHWFDSKADFSGDLEDYIDDTNEFLFGLEVDPLDCLTFSGGLQVTEFGITNEYISDMNINLSAKTFGLGFAYHPFEWFNVNVGYFHTLYERYHDKEAYGNVTYSRTSRGVGLGLDFNL